jgi:predicted SAM-dependent methyltransferase
MRQPCPPQSQPERSLVRPPSASRLHVGCGPRAHIEGWWNVDIQAFPGVDERLDATAAWPYPDGSLDYVYAEHFIEHLEIDGVVSFLEEARRCLKPGGRVRLSTPSLEWVLVSHYELGSEPGRQIDDTLRMNCAFRGWQHQFLYSREMLSYVLEQCGFAQLEFCEYGESEDVNLRNLEKHGGYSWEGGYPSVWIVEATHRGDAIKKSAELREKLEADYCRHVRSGH